MNFKKIIGLAIPIVLIIGQTFIPGCAALGPPAKAKKETGVRILSPGREMVEGIIMGKGYFPPEYSWEKGKYLFKIKAGEETYRLDIEESWKSDCTPFSIYQSPKYDVGEKVEFPGYKNYLQLDPSTVEQLAEQFADKLLKYDSLDKVYLNIPRFKKDEYGTWVGKIPCDELKPVPKKKKF